MNGAIIFGIFLIVYIVLAGIAYLIDYKDKVERKRTQKRTVFLLNHPKYTENEDGELCKRQ